MTTACIVQARMGSSRLPGKVLMPLGPKTVLAHVLERCRAIRGVDVVCCATVETPENGLVAAEARRVGAEVFYGSEDDVLDRYYRAAKALKAALILRVTSDCPLIDPQVCQAVIELRERHGADYACNNMPPSWPHGLDCEIFTAEWLERAAVEARKPSEREHVSPYIRNHPEVSKVNLPGPGDKTVGYRWTLDTEADLRFLREVFQRLPAGEERFDYRAVLRILEQEPELLRLNAGQDRYEGLKKSLQEDAARTTDGAVH